MKKKQPGPQAIRNRKSDARKGDARGSANLDRRSFVKLLPAAGAAGLAVSGMPLRAIAQTPTPTPVPSPRPSPTPLRITKDMMHNAEKLIGIELTDKHEDMALPGVNRLGALSHSRRVQWLADCGRYAFP